ncbi:MAG: pyruvate kinase, partial [Firmicutes bacterium]|nr:pyruvate kinase [Bacillota bacterium]
REDRRRQNPVWWKRTKIVATLGPASSEDDILTAMVENGLNLVRVNLSHGTYEEHRERIQMARRVSQATGRTIGVILDIQGPKIRIGEVPGGRLTLRPHDRIILAAQSGPVPTGSGARASAASPPVIPVGYPPLADDVAPGSTIYLDDANIELRVVSVSPPEVLCEVVVGGDLTAHKGVSLPGVRVDLPALTEKDRQDVAFGVREGVDFIAQSFVREASNVRELRAVLEQLGGRQHIIAKIESSDGLENLDEIIEAADAVMVARGDLGVGIPPQKVPLMQKLIIRKCNQAGKPVITATQMLQSMVRSPRPTRAEVTDVANAILDGTDAVMLSGETAVGQYPREAVLMMSQIALEVEAVLDHGSLLEERRLHGLSTVADAISHATCQAALDLGAAAIITSTQSGATARKVSKFRPAPPVVAATPDPLVQRQLSLNWGVFPVLVPKTDNIDAMLDVSEQAALEAGLVHPGDRVVITAGVRTGMPGSTNLLQVHTIGSER